MGAEHKNGGYHPPENSNTARGRTESGIPPRKQVDAIARRAMRREHPSGKQTRRGR